MKKRVKVFAVLMALAASGFALSASAQEDDEALGPDLFVYSALFSPEPKVGQPVGKVIVVVKNQGTDQAPSSKLKLNCSADECSDQGGCVDVCSALNTVIDVKALKIGESVNVEWTPETQIKWAKGNFVITVAVDYGNRIVELDENNNTRKVVISAASFLVQ